MQGKRIKFIIFLAIVTLIALFALTVFQLIDLHKTKKQLTFQQEQISQLEKELDYYQNKQSSQEA